MERGVPQGYHLDPGAHGTLADIYEFTEQAHRTLLVDVRGLTAFFLEDMAEAQHALTF